MSKQNPLFVPRNGYGNFILSVFMTTVKMLVILILIFRVSILFIGDFGCLLI